MSLLTSLGWRKVADNEGNKPAAVNRLADDADASVSALKTFVDGFIDNLTELANRTLSNLTDVAVARANLGLGNSATRVVGTAAGTVAAGDHTHDTGFFLNGISRGGGIFEWLNLSNNPANPRRIYTNDIMWGGIIVDGRIDFTGKVGFGNTDFLAYAGLRYTMNPNTSNAVVHQSAENTEGALIRSIMFTVAGAERRAFEIVPTWANNTDTNRRPRALFRCFDYTDTPREVMRQECDGPTTKVSFHGADAIAKRTLPALATDQASAIDLANACRTLLIDIGLAQ
jgi:hypothetical protein